MSKSALSLLLFCSTTSNAQAVTAKRQQHAAADFLNSHTEQFVRKDERLLKLTEEQHEVVPYEIWDPSKIPPVLEEWAEKYPDLISVTTAQEAYGLPTAGTASDCPFDKGKGCLNYMFTIQDFISHPVDSESSNNLPEVFWSGCVHGNERVGPTSVMEAANLLLESAHCEGLPRGSPSAKGLKEARECRKALHNKGIDDVHRKWLARLVSTRRIVVVPTANALGYYRNKREEGHIDPNRDFPYDLQDWSLCMQTIAGRTINEIYREHMFQLALTFHGGMEVVAYEWGAPTWYNHLSPDDEAQTQIGGAYSQYGGGWATDTPYKHGTMNDEVYYVRGGMEDWAYAGSWTPKLLKPCTPKTFGGYPPEKTTYNNSTLRAFNMLVETSDDKFPKDHLGSSLDILSGDTEGNGHISRNIRLSLLSADLVEPYVGIVGVNKLALTDDIVPMMNRDAKSCQKTKAVTVANNAETVNIEWTVGGSLAVDKTQLWYAHWDAVADEIECWTQPSSTQNLKRTGDILSGSGYFSKSGSIPSPEGSATGMKMTNGPLFRASVPLTEFKKGDKVVIIASATVDQSWKQQPEDILPKMAPQSHIVNARTDPNYHHEGNGKHIQGRIEWFSVPLTVVVGDFQDSIGTRGDDAVNVIEIHPRLGETATNKGGVKPKAAQTEQPKVSQTEQLWVPVSLWELLAIAGLVLTVAICCFRRNASDYRVKIKQDESFSGSDDFTFEDNKYTDRVNDEYGDDDDSNDGIEIPSIS